MRLSNELRREHEGLWEKMVGHPFVVEMGDGTLSPERFQRYLEQDYLFVMEFVRVLALGIAKAPDIDMRKRLADFTAAVLGGGRDFFRTNMRQMGRTDAEIEALSPLPTCLSFSNHMLTTAYDGNFYDILTVLYCLEASYLDWGQRLVQSGALERDSLYKGWIEIHAAQPLVDFVTWLTDRVDETPEYERDKMHRLVAECLGYEVLFWDMAYDGEEWPS